MKGILKVTCGLFMLAIILAACGGGGGGSSDPAPTYTVTYNANGATAGTVPTDSTNYTQGQVVTVPDNPGNLVKTHYDFAGWNTAADGSGTTYAQGQTFKMGSANVTLYAKWTAKPTYTVTYDGNGATGGTEPVDNTNYEETQTVTVKGNTGFLIKTGSTFASWNTKADGTGTTYAQGATFAMGTSNVTLYAQWTANPTYNVTYNANGATGGNVPTDTNNYEQGFIVTVLGNPLNLVKTHYNFSGWNTKPDGTGTTYAQGQTFTMGSADVTLYAKWTPKPTYTVTYDGNGNTGGSVPVDSTAYEEGQTVTVLGNPLNLVKTQYDFAGWNTQADGNGTTYAQGATFPMGAANVTLYAKWTAKPTYTMTYNGNGSTTGSPPSDPTHYEEGQTVTVLGNTGNLVKTNYYFSGWNTQADGNGTTYAPGATFAMGTSNVTLYAKWTVAPYTVTYNGNGNTGGAVPVDNNTYGDGQTVMVLGNTGSLVRTNYSFAGWNTQADGNGTDRAPASTFAMGASNVTLYAKWVLNGPYGGPYVADAYTVLLDHFDGSLTSPGAIYGYEGPTHTCDTETFIAEGLTPVFVAGKSGFGQALSLSPPAGYPNGASFLEYYDGGGTYRNILKIPNGTLEFWVFLSSYGASGLHLADQLPYYSVCYDATFSLDVSSTGVLSASFNNAAFSMNSGATTVPLNTWTHVAVSWGDTGAKLYINGAQVGSNASTASPASGGSVELSFRLGTESGATTLMDEMRVSNIQRTW